MEGRNVRQGLGGGKECKTGIGWREGRNVRQGLDGGKECKTGIGWRDGM